MKHSALSIIFISLLSGCAAKNHYARASTPLISQPAPPAQEKPTSLSALGRDPAEFPAYVDTLKAEARGRGIPSDVIAESFANIHFVDRAIAADRNQPEAKLTLDAYLARVLTADKIAQGKAMMARYRTQLRAVSERYGVAPQYIVALWGMESQYGKIQGKEDIVSALATLAFEGRRETFFKNQLFAALQMIQRGANDAQSMKGSWAGAMGQNQFMPGSYLHYGADGDGDGRIDIWNNPDDVFASTARYLARSGWRVEVTLPAGFDSALIGVKKAQGKSVARWLRQGLTPQNAAPPAAQTAWIVQPDDTQGRAFMVYDNFRTLMRWNRSYYFAISVGMLADAIA
ncbi:lytic murein transglycosylase [Pantoea sp.]|uniref:lytic murein transglycosylase n=1 Tax=Pantoea sp. TaxID=69393 RepID=UPI0028A2CEAB|nr:lytic murein transglycosylase [Pantoea sp.]